jgi:dolichyl-diphosphooligosaccharide--protein glycosyltransferase
LIAGNRKHPLLERFSLALLFLVAFLVRCLPFTSVFVGERINFVSFDAYYHLRRVRYALGDSPLPLEFDPYVHFPSGGEPIWPPLFDAFLCALVRPFATHADKLRVEQLLVWVPPLLGACTVVVLFYFAKRHFGLATAWLSSLLLCVLPAHFYYSRLSFLDHHVAVGLLSTLLLAGSMELLRAEAARPEERHRQLWISLFLGAICALNLLIWPGTILHLATLEVGLITVLLFRAARGEASGLAASLAIKSLVALALILPFSATNTWSQWGDYSAVVLSRFQPWFFAALALYYASCVSFWHLTRKRRSFGGRVAATFGIGAAILGGSVILLPDLLVAISEAWSWMSREDLFQSGVAESTPLFGSGERVSVKLAERLFLHFVYVFPIALVAIAWVHRRHEDAGARLLLCGWGLVFAVATLAQHRFHNTLSIVFALVIGWMLARLIAWLRGLEAALLRGSLLALLAGAAFFPASLAFWYYLPMIQNDYRALRGKEIKLPAREELQLLHHELAEWLREHTPPTRGLYDATESPEYGVLAPWGIGHTIKYVGERPTVVDNFGDDVGREQFALAMTFSDLRPEAAARLLDDLKVRYVVLRRKLSRAGLHRRMFVREDAMLPHFRLVFESSPRPRFRRPEYKIFEYVKGARVVGHAEPGAEVQAALAYSTNRARRGVMRATTRADPEGVYRLVLPYANHAAPGSIRPGAEYSLESGGRRAPLVIGDAQVALGHEVAGPDLRR